MDSGTPQPPEKPRGWIPPIYAEVFDIHERPTHNYPMPMAETCLSLSEKTSGYIFVEAVERWVTHIRTSLPPMENEEPTRKTTAGSSIFWYVRLDPSTVRNT